MYGTHCDLMFNFQDGTFTFSEFAGVFDEYDVQRVLRSYENSISIHVHCCARAEWTQVMLFLYQYHICFVISTEFSLAFYLRLSRREQYHHFGFCALFVTSPKSLIISFITLSLFTKSQSKLFEARLGDFIFQDTKNANKQT